MSLETTSAEMVRSVMEGVAYNSRWLLGYIEKFTKQHLSPIRLLGGGAQSDLWCQIYADVLARPVEQVPDPTFAQMRGMAVLASVALGRRTLEQSAEVLTRGRTYEPVSERAAMYDQLAGELPEIYAEGKKRWRAINAS